MKLFIHLLVIFILMAIIPSIIQAKELKHHHNDVIISDLKKKIDFNIYIPEQVPDNCTLEIKTYPWGEQENISYFRLHYIDNKKEQLLFGIEERAKSSMTEEISLYAKPVNINGYKGYFEAWGNSGELDNKGELVTGGLLTWIQEGTHIQMNSSRITAYKMLEIARSMKIDKHQ